jgi:ribosomal protein S18 acetylase RimI-like enzyme
MKSKLILRAFREDDIPWLVEILRSNNMYDYPEVEGPEAMKRVASCESAVMVIAEFHGLPRGFIKAVYDGSRALIHLLAVHPEYQRLGIGTRLVRSASEECERRGAPSLSVTVTSRSELFWKKQGFEMLPVFLMLRLRENP